MTYELVTVFGGSGFIGRHTVRALAQAGYRVRVAVRKPNNANYLLPAGTVGQIQILKSNVLRDDDVAEAVHGAHAVINLVGVLKPWGSQRFEALHVDAAARVAAAAAEAGAQVMVHLSALGASLESASSYARSKAKGEAKVREAFPAATILRPSLVFGPEDDFFNRFAGMARFSPFLPLIGGGQTKFQPVFVGDVAAAIRKAVVDPATARGRAYDLGGPVAYSFRELLEIVLRDTGRRRILLPIPFALASFGAALTQFLPLAPLTMDQVTLLKQDNVLLKGALTFDDLRLDPTTVEAIVPSYLWRFRPKGQFHAMASASAGTP
ncbi:MAG: complex I NDUFA9 subunit family protein [Alphaproteobacteria bacterium]|nr:complex I NDUFA9 subunit family protein [Alphaproteobacteria bacterium]MDE1987459.1 complex I NDUFA9 subunit family protein [Alphaproteobacteria bacterium]MDE2267022.1 complex I NDUFA9 subunit family protein [Alphaproteobacteria bacterium]